ncbi:uncharacterized protein LOC117112933 [Anneissia japonica]|uniref:uncharacterized protein LOC117112933 n=1 Tax=Anneissia japonica TaxID=1529436 RepID=UPI00142578CC|nr:uncharacterized protein LOC117112933 [Anneissia japonica]
MGYNSHEECTITVPEGWIDITCYWPYAFAICEKAAMFGILFRINDGCSNDVVPFSMWTQSRVRCARACWEHTGCSSFNCIKHAELHFECQLIQTKFNVNTHEDDECATYQMI